MIRIYLIAIVSGLLASLFMTPVSVWLAKKFGAMDPVAARKVHRSEMPRWGGIGVVSGILAAIFILTNWIPEFRDLLSVSWPIERKGTVLFTLNLGDQLAGMVMGLLVLFVLGVIDDRRPVKPGMKFLIQIIAAYVAMTYGVKIYGLRVPGFESYAFFPLWLMQIITILWLVGLTNAVNLIDGLDGLAGGVVAIAAGAFLSIVLIQNGTISPLFHHQMRLAGVMAAAILGGVAGFLIYNFHPAHVFMGDSGSMSLGFLLGCLAVIGAFKTTILAVLIVPFLLAAIPLADMTLAFGRRILRRQNPFSPDRSHIHHLLIDAGWTHREVVLLIYVVTLVMALVSVTVVGMKDN